MTHILGTPAIWQKYKPACLLGIILGITVLYLTYCWATQNISSLGSSFIFISGAGVLLWKKRRNFQLKSDYLSSIIGIIAIATFVISPLLPFAFTTTVPLFFCMAMLGVGMLAVGMQGLKRYWRECSLILTIAIPGSNFFIWCVK